MGGTGGFVRYLDVFTNTSTVPQQVPVSLATTPDQSKQVVLDVGPSPATPGYFVRADPGQGALSFGVVYSGVNPPMALTPAVGADQVTQQPGTTLLLAPGQSVALLHFLVMHPPADAAGAVTAAESLATLTEPDALTGISTSDLGLIVNFLVP